ncbi:hypothetical protein Dimus_014183 [Dionaea muscipula]
MSSSPFSAHSHTTDQTKVMISFGLHRRILEGDVNLEEFTSGYYRLMELRGLEGDTVLHLAARAGRSRLITRILDMYNDLIKTKNWKGELPLHVAARAGELDSVKCLVEWIVHYTEHRGASGQGEGGPNQDGTNQNQEEEGEIRIQMDRVTEVNGEGHTASSCPFYWSDTDTDTDIASSEDGTNQNQQDQGIRIEMDLVAEVNGEGDTALHIALKNHNEEMAAYLVDKYPSASYYANYSNVSPLYLAIKAGYWELAQSMLARKPIGDEDVKNRLLQGKSVVHAAIMVRNTGHLDAVRYLLDEFPNYAYKVDKDSSFPIHQAARGGHVLVMEEFLSRFPSMKNMRNQQCLNILHMASISGKTDMVSYLLKIQDIDRLINMRDKNGNTPLHLAVLGGHVKVVSIFTWDERVDLSLQNKLGMTALNVVEYNYYGSTLSIYEQRLAWLALSYANAPRARCPNPKQPNPNNYKDRVSTLLLVSMLVTTVTFAAGFTIPGGYSSSGLAIFAHKPKFQAFVITNTTALYSSILAVLALIYAQFGDLRLILVSLKFAVPLLGISLAMMSVTFMVGVDLLVNDICWLSILILVIGSIFLVSALIFFIPLFSPRSIKRRFVRYIFYFPFQMMLLLCHDSDADKDS